MSAPTKQFILCVGSPQDGFTFYGPISGDDPDFLSAAAMFDISFWAELVPLPDEPLT